MADWICTKCGNEVMTNGEQKPTQLPWSDGHKCSMIRLDKLDPATRAQVVEQIEENL